MALAALNLPDLPASAGEISLGELRAFVVLKPTRSTRKKLPSDLRGLISQISDISNRLLSRVLDARSAADFEARMREVFGDYVRSQNALAELAQIVVPPPLLEKLADEAFDGIDATLEAEVLPRFGVAARDQAKFTAWTVRRILVILKRVVEAGPPVEQHDKEKDKELERQFTVALWFAFFHMDCLRAAIRLDKPLRPDIVNQIVDGLRTAVNAYAIVRQGLALRGGISQRDAVIPTEWDEEDQELLDSSMADLGRDER